MMRSEPKPQPKPQPQPRSQPQAAKEREVIELLGTDSDSNYERGGRRHCRILLVFV